MPQWKDAYDEAQREKENERKQREHAVDKESGDNLCDQFYDINNEGQEVPIDHGDD